MSGRIAILIDGGYFLKRLPKLVTSNRCDTPQNIVACIRQLCRTHVKRLTGKDDARWQQHLYRSFFYDAYSKKLMLICLNILMACSLDSLALVAPVTNMTFLKSLPKIQTT
ncbi:hypothetical protein HF285_14120 [Acidithiobacillus ferrooxidans F221]|uniref:hypothetical protein n=1 Tax=Acidithiobacillus ferrooxidans TaxID=920 RepID=UPI001C06B4B8|nr:hypothetical protein [Acidithiobacillus ferrooxidans]MBU2809352.1 hypothetical protein [Acidithiobacillus ferrooxidans F221]